MMGAHYEFLPWGPKGSQSAPACMGRQKTVQYNNFCVTRLKIREMSPPHQPFLDKITPMRRLNSDLALELYLGNHQNCLNLNLYFFSYTRNKH